MTDGPELHDFSRLDAHMAARRRATVLHSLWRPLLAGAVASLAVSAAIWVVLPKVTVRDYEVPRITMRDVTADRVTPRDVTINNLIPKDLVVEIPRIAVTPAEKKFLDSKDYAAAEIKGRIVPSVDGTALSFDTGKNWYPADPDKVSDSAAFIGDYAYCAPTADKTIFHCFALHNGTTVSVPQKHMEGRPT